MRGKKRFQAGDFVRIIKAHSPHYGKMSEIIQVDEITVIVKLFSNQYLTLSAHEIIPLLKEQKFQKLYIAHLLQLQLLAVDINDRQWFEEIGQKLNAFKNYIP